jgi:hypothetical protein
MSEIDDSKLPTDPGGVMTPFGLYLAWWQLWVKPLPRIDEPRTPPRVMSGNVIYVEFKRRRKDRLRIRA